MMADKRRGEAVTSSVLTKRARVEDEGDDVFTGALVGRGTSQRADGTVIRGVRRTSHLQAPIMQLTGQDAEILAIAFSPNGDNLASASADRTISLWKVYGDCANYGKLIGHNGIVTDLCWSRVHSRREEERLYSCSTDGTIVIWDTWSGKKLHKIQHSYVSRRGGQRGGMGLSAGFVNSIALTKSGQEILASVGDDGFLRIWDPQASKANSLSLQHKFGHPLTAICWSQDSQQIFVGGVDNQIHAFSISKEAVLYSFTGHTDTITSLSLSPSGSTLFSVAQDSTCRLWDVRPFSPVQSRCHAILTGAPSGFEKYLIRGCWEPLTNSRAGPRVMAGSADRTVVVWDIGPSEGDGIRPEEDIKIQYKLSGHHGTVTAVAWHPSEPIIATGSVDRQIFLGEIEPR